MKRTLATLLAAAALAVGLSAPAARAAEQRIDIGWTTWGDAEVVSKLAALVLGQGMKRDVELTLSDIEIQYRGVAEGDLDAMLMSWQPNTHADFLRKYEGKLVDAGPLYEGARLGLAVPSYVDAEVATIADLADASERFSGRIVGIDPNSGIMKSTRAALDAYGLDYEVEAGTGPKMAKIVSRAVEEGEWIVFTGWTPHWIFGAHDLRFLDDPKGVFGGSESVHAVVRQGLPEEDPQAFAFFQTMSFEIDDLQSLMADAHEQGHRAAIAAWINTNMDVVRGWMAAAR